MDMKCLIGTGVAAFAIVGLLVWSQVVYPYTVLVLMMVIALGLFVYLVWHALYSFCSWYAIKKNERCEDMIRGIHYDIDPRSESLRTPNE